MPRDAGQGARPASPVRPLTHGYPLDVPEPSYSSGDDYVVEFLGFHFSFNAFDFEQRVTAAAVKLGLVEGNDLDEDETADLVELTADGRIVTKLGRAHVGAPAQTDHERLF